MRLGWRSGSVPVRNEPRQGRQWIGLLDSLKKNAPQADGAFAYLFFCGLCHSPSSERNFRSGTATVLTAISSSALLLMRSADLSPGKVRFVGRLSAGMAGAEARIEGRAAGLAGEKLEAYVASTVLKRSRAYAGETVAVGLATEVSAGGWLMMSGRLILIATGWKVAVILTVITLIYNYFTPDDLENWLSSSPFGTAPDKGRTLEKQQAAFEAALAATGN